MLKKSHIGILVALSVLMLIAVVASYLPTQFSNVGLEFSQNDTSSKVFRFDSLKAQFRYPQNFSPEVSASDTQVKFLSVESASSISLALKLGQEVPRAEEANDSTVAQVSFGTFSGTRSHPGTSDYVYNVSTTLPDGREVSVLVQAFIDPAHDTLARLEEWLSIMLTSLTFDPPSPTIPTSLEENLYTTPGGRALLRAPKGWTALVHVEQDSALWVTFAETHGDTDSISVAIQPQAEGFDFEAYVNENASRPGVEILSRDAVEIAGLKGYLFETRDTARPAMRLKTLILDGEKSTYIYSGEARESEYGAYSALFDAVFKTITPM